MQTLCILCFVDKYSSTALSVGVFIGSLVACIIATAVVSTFLQMIICQQIKSLYTFNMCELQFIQNIRQITQLNRSCRFILSIGITKDIFVYSLFISEKNDTVFDNQLCLNADDRNGNYWPIIIFLNLAQTLLKR